MYTQHHATYYIGSSRNYSEHCIVYPKATRPITFKNKSHSNRAHSKIYKLILHNNASTNNMLILYGYKKKTAGDVSRVCNM